MEVRAVRLCIESLSERSTRYLRTVELCFQYSFLRGREQIGRLTPEDEDKLTALSPVFVGDGSLVGRRNNRRHATYLPAIVKAPGFQGHAILLNLSSRGIFVATTQAINPGTVIQVKVGSPDRLEYLFTCRVLRKARGKQMIGLGCQFTGAPVELRYPTPRSPN